jgi:NADH dehydrogenase (ubiquinone) 1 alpha subcomplex subunit 8
VNGRKVILEGQNHQIIKMPFTNEDYLPSPQELENEEINMSSAPLRAGAHHFGKYCDNQSKEYMLCLGEENDPRKCLKEGKAVTNCGLQFFRKMRDNCAEEFTAYWKCLDHSQYDMAFKHCRSKQAPYDKCVLEQFGQERPELGFFSKVRVHDSIRPKPRVEVPLPANPPRPAPNVTDAPKPSTIDLGTRAF